MDFKKDSVKTNVSELESSSKQMINEQIIRLEETFLIPFFKFFAHSFNFSCSSWQSRSRVQANVCLQKRKSCSKTAFYRTWFFRTVRISFYLIYDFAAEASQSIQHGDVKLLVESRKLQINKMLSLCKKNNLNSTIAICFKSLHLLLLASSIVVIRQQHVFKIIN